jgi:hypothetical protein
MQQLSAAILSIQPQAEEMDIQEPLDLTSSSGSVLNLSPISNHNSPVPECLPTPPATPPQQALPPW